MALQNDTPTTYRLIDGKQTAEDIKAEIAAEVAQRKAAGHKVPHLAAVLVGHDGGSETYVRNKVLACERVGFASTLLRYEDDLSEAALLAKVAELNDDPAIDGFIVQLPLPAHIDTNKVIEAIRPEKDVDGFPPHEHRPDGGRLARPAARHTLRHRGAAGAAGHPNQRQTLRGNRAVQHCGYAR